MLWLSDQTLPTKQILSVPNSTHPHHVLCKHWTTLKLIEASKSTYKQARGMNMCILFCTVKGIVKAIVYIFLNF